MSDMSRVIFFSTVEQRDLLEDKGVRFREPIERTAQQLKLSYKNPDVKILGGVWETIREGWMAFFDKIPVSDPQAAI